MVKPLNKQESGYIWWLNEVKDIYHRPHAGSRLKGWLKRQASKARRRKWKMALEECEEQYESFYDAEVEEKY